MRSVTVEILGRLLRTSPAGRCDSWPATEERRPRSSASGRSRPRVLPRAGFSVSMNPINGEAAAAAGLLFGPPTLRWGSTEDLVDHAVGPPRSICPVMRQADEANLGDERLSPAISLRLR